MSCFVLAHRRQPSRVEDINEVLTGPEVGTPLIGPCCDAEHARMPTAEPEHVKMWPFAATTEQSRQPDLMQPAALLSLLEQGGRGCVEASTVDH